MVRYYHHESATGCLSGKLRFPSKSLAVVAVLIHSFTKRAERWRNNEGRGTRSFAPRTTDLWGRWPNSCVLILLSPTSHDLQHQRLFVQYWWCVARLPSSGGQFNSYVEISTEFSTDFSIEFLVLQGYKNSFEKSVEISTKLLNEPWFQLLFAR